MKVFELTSPWISHQKAAEPYRRGLALAGVELADRASKADVVMVHGAPSALKGMVAKVNPGGRPVAAYTTWETSQAPDDLKRWLDVFAAVLTPSEFCRTALAPWHPNVRVVPHAMEHANVPDIARDAMVEKIGRDKRYTFLTITDASNPRKNLPALLSVFAALEAAYPGRARLIVKHYCRPPGMRKQAGVVHLTDQFLDAQIRALYAVCDCYVSLHRGEGWGLPMSEAMAASLPVIATGYSGNMEFMTQANSFPVAHKEVCVSLPAGNPWRKCFRPWMTWAEPDAGNALALMIEQMKRGVSDGMHEAIAETVKRFSVSAVTSRMLEVLQEVAK